MKYRLVIFDLDGTLLDTLDDLTVAVNHALSLHGYPQRKREEVRHWIGYGIANTIRQAVPKGTEEHECACIQKDFKEYYLSHVNVHTRPYNGIEELLDRLTAAGVALAVNSNKLDSAVNELCAAHFPNRIAISVGERPDIPKKPAANGVELILGALSVSPDQTIYVGDGESDLRTAANAGIECAWVSWGYRDAEDLSEFDIPYSFDSADELGAFLLDN